MNQWKRIAANHKVICALCNRNGRDDCEGYSLRHRGKNKKFGTRAARAWFKQHNPE